jgi:hypothetical protein
MGIAHCALTRRDGAGEATANLGQSVPARGGRPLVGRDALSDLRAAFHSVRELGLLMRAANR